MANEERESVTKLGDVIYFPNPWDNDGINHSAQFQYNLDSNLPAGQLVTWTYNVQWSFLDGRYAFHGYPVFGANHDDNLDAQLRWTNSPGSAANDPFQWVQDTSRGKMTVAFTLWRREDDARPPGSNNVWAQIPCWPYDGGNPAKWGAPPQLVVELIRQ